MEKVTLLLEDGENLRATKGSNGHVHMVLDDGAEPYDGGFLTPTSAFNLGVTIQRAAEWARKKSKDRDGDVIGGVDTFTRKGEGWLRINVEFLPSNGRIAGGAVFLAFIQGHRDGTVDVELTPAQASQLAKALQRMGVEPENPPYLTTRMRDPLRHVRF